MSGKPRILCLHGGGVSAKIFELQMRTIIKSLASDFRLVFVDGPWLSEMHDDLLTVYSSHGPCYRWGNWLTTQSAIDESFAIKENERVLVEAMDKDEGDGEWVGLLGFSQGATLAFSILLENQLRLQGDPRATAFTGVYWQFGIIMAGRAPPYSLNPITQKDHQYKSLTQVSEGRDIAPVADPFLNRLRTPTLHVHGMQDPGLELHRDLQEWFASPEHTWLVEWEGAHRIPFKSADVKRTTEAILEVANV